MHRYKGCVQRRSCKICTGQHPTGLHDDNFRPKSKNETEQSKDTTTRKPGDKTDNDNSDDSDKNCAYAVADEVLCDASNMKCSIESMPIVPVKLRSNGKEIITYAMLDSMQKL